MQRYHMMKSHIQPYPQGDRYQKAYGCGNKVFCYPFAQVPRQAPIWIHFGEQGLLPLARTAACADHSQQRLTLHARF